MMFLLGGAAMLLAWYLSGKYFIESPAGWRAKGREARLKNISCRWSRKSRKRKTSLTVLAGCPGGAVRGKRLFLAAV
jgi:putative MFS transporter